MKLQSCTQNNLSYSFCPAGVSRDFTTGRTGHWCVPVCMCVCVCVCMCVCVCVAYKELGSVFRHPDTTSVRAHSLYYARELHCGSLPPSWGSELCWQTLRGPRRRTSAAAPPGWAAPPSRSSSASSLGGRRAWTACPCAEGEGRKTAVMMIEVVQKWQRGSEDGGIVEDQSGRAAEDTPWLVIKDQREQDFHKHTLSLHALWSLCYN